MMAPRRLATDDGECRACRQLQRSKACGKHTRAKTPRGGGGKEAKGPTERGGRRAAKNPGGQRGPQQKEGGGQTAKGGGGGGGGHEGEARTSEGLRCVIGNLCRESFTFHIRS